LDGYISDFSEDLLAILGFKRDNFESKPFSHFIDTSDPGHFSRSFQAIKENRENEFNVRVVLKDAQGEAVPFKLIGSLVRDQKGEKKYIHGVLQCRKPISSLTSDLDQMNDIFEHIPLPIFHFDKEGHLEGLNQELADFIGLPPQSLIGLNYDQFIPKEDLDKCDEHFEAALNGETRLYETRVMLPNNELRSVIVIKFPRIENNEITGVYNIMEDLTIKKESEQRWERLVEQSPLPIQISSDGKIVFINQKGAEYYGAKDPEKIIGKELMSFAHPDFKERLLDRKERLEKNQQVESGEHKIITLKGEERFIEAHSIPIRYRGAQAVQTVINDITKRKNREISVVKSLEEKELLLKEIHHRVKNNLAVISGLLELQVLNSEDQKTIDTLKDSQVRINSIAMIHQKLYQSESLSTIQLGPYLEDLTKTIAQTFNNEHKDIRISFEYDDIELDIQQTIPCSLIVNEVLTNCFKHAFDQSDSGSITIEARHSESSISFVIEDNGKGLPDGFDFSGLHTLGITLISSLSEQLNGAIELKNRTDEQGTRFIFKFDLK
jgi:PAS domain S-box-containing protein